MSRREPEKRKIASYKLEPSRSIPMRLGPLQCLRSCAYCVPKGRNDEQIYSQVELLNVKSFDNLITRANHRFSNYQSIQYHRGQLDILKQASKSNPNQPFIYIVATNTIDDIKYLEFVLGEGQCDIKHSIKVPTLIKTASQLTLTPWQVESVGISFAVLLKRKSCVVIDDKSTDKFFNLQTLNDMFEVILTSDKLSEDCCPILVPVSITKDHDIKTKFGFGSIAIQILEPFSANSYLEKVSKEQFSSWLTIHIYHDITKASIVLAPNLVAFLILYLQREHDGVHQQDLIDYVDWFRKSSLNLDIQLGFTGASPDVVNFGLFVLKDYIKKTACSSYLMRNEQRLLDYANIVVPIIVYYGVLSRAILIEHNKSNPDNPLTHFRPDVCIKVSKDKAFETAEELSKTRLERHMACRRPCALPITKLEDAFMEMSSYERFFKVEGPRTGLVQRIAYHTGDFEIDEDYNYRSRQKEAFQSSIIVTQRPYRLDRLNLFINAIDSHLYDDQSSH